MSVAVNGVPTKEELQRALPPKRILNNKAVVMVECFQNIPCDPCAHACPYNAILPFKDINDLPQVDYDKCIGCGLCISSCPGLAIFVIDMGYSPKEALIKLPYEMLPLPEKGQVVSGLDREGNKIADVVVQKVTKTRNKTSIISIIIPKELAIIIRNIKVEDQADG
jgi:Fe-S-cluster-containing hydrogenase component 2